MSWLGLDIGGANLKAANPQGWARSMPFPLWRDPHGLAAALRTLVDFAPTWNKLAVTMTGELCDCFCSKAEGVRHILEAVGQAANDSNILVYLVDGRFVSIEAAKASPKLAAASNWHALASYAARHLSGQAGLLIDVGSTTTDIIPIRNGKVVACGRTDMERLLSRELVYQGVGRTPVCAITQTLPVRGELCPVAAEVFATSADAYLLVGLLEEDLEAAWTADGRGLTKDFAKKRLARQLCADVDELSYKDFEIVARAIVDSQSAIIANAIATVSLRCDEFKLQYMTSGLGERLVGEILARSGKPVDIRELSRTLGTPVSRSAAAFAVAVLAQELET